MTQAHRSIWKKFLEPPHLKRILNHKPEIVKHPVTNEGLMFVNLIILHLTVLTAVAKGAFPKPAGLDVDIRDFSLLPIPRAIWNRTKTFRDPQTIRYVESLVKGSPADRSYNNTIGMTT